MIISVFSKDDEQSSTSDEVKNNQSRQSSCARLVFDDEAYFEVIAKFLNYY
jgi:hypothetical protein